MMMMIEGNKCHCLMKETLSYQIPALCVYHLGITDPKAKL